MRQRVEFTRLRDGTRVAYARLGSGPFLVLPPGWVSHLELAWALPPERRYYEVLASGRTLVRYDRPGCGLSDRMDREASLEADLEVLEAVVAAVGASRFDLMGSSLGAAIAIAWAALRPDTVQRLVLYGGWLRGPDIAPSHVREHVIGLVRTHWRFGSEILADIFIPDGGPVLRAAFQRYTRDAASSETAARLLELSYRIDVTRFAERVHAPTLVLHREGDRAAPFAQGALVARSIPGARLERLAGRSHIPFLGDTASILTPVRRFLGLPRARGRVTTLTSRQRQVADLVTKGLTNRDIAERLGIGERAAEGHVERIRNRLGVRSRAQIAAWWAASADSPLAPPEEPRR